jgi:hypothetical protein
MTRAICLSFALRLPLCMALGACATYDDVSYLKDPMLEHVQPTVTGAQGPLSLRASNSLLHQRWKSSYIVADRKPQTFKNRLA